MNKEKVASELLKIAKDLLSASPRIKAMFDLDLEPGPITEKNLAQAARKNRVKVKFQESPNVGYTDIQMTGAEDDIVAIFKSFDWDDHDIQYYILGK